MEKDMVCLSSLKRYETAVDNNSTNTITPENSDGTCQVSYNGQDCLSCTLCESNNPGDAADAMYTERMSFSADCSNVWEDAVFSTCSYDYNKQNGRGPGFVGPFTLLPHFNHLDQFAYPGPPIDPNVASGTTAVCDTEQPVGIQVGLSSNPRTESERLDIQKNRTQPERVDIQKEFIPASYILFVSHLHSYSSSVP
jgi:hypothetical protein